MTPLLNQHQQKDLLRIFTCGSVDDGKSTLIGRLLYDAGLVYEDQLATIVAESERRGLKEPDLSLLLDGLQAEREQGITIDVAYRYFSTAHRKFIVADTPGHEQYTCNMVTGASHCELALILIDARKGVLEQTRRHTAIVNMLGIQHIAMLVNKMDLVAYKESVYRGIQQQVLELADQLGVRNLRFFPVSALAGDNIVHRSEQTPWFQEEPLLTWLESVSPRTADAQRAFRFPVQYVNRPHQDFRGYCGSVLAGQVSVGDEVIVLPNNVANRVRRILHFEGERGAASAGEAVTLELEKETDISRGDVLVRRDDEPMTVTDQFEANVVWMASEALTPGKRYELRLGTVAVPATIKRLIHRLNIHSFAEEDANRLERNDIGRCEVALEQAIPCDRYAEIPATGAFILVDRVSNHTIGAGMITATAGRKVIWQEVQVNKAARAQQKGQTPKVIWFTGLSGSGKSTLANALEQRLLKLGYHSYLLDGDNVRHGLNRDLGFTDEDRVENIRRVGEVAKLMVDAGLLVLVSFISPFRSERQLVREMLEDGEFVEVYVNTPLDVCEQRDPKGLYKLARDGKIPHFTGISSPYEAPDAPELTLNTHETDTETNLNLLLQELKAR
jgi:bifunctional enzyme CysN/CysC